METSNNVKRILKYFQKGTQNIIETQKFCDL